MTRFRALVLAGVLALTFNFVGCFDHGGPQCDSVAPAGDTELPCGPGDR